MMATPSMSPSANLTSAMSRPAMSPPLLPTSHTYHPHIASMLPVQESSPSSPPLSYGQYSSPPSPSNVKEPSSVITPGPWPSSDGFENSLYTAMDPLLPANDSVVSHPVWPDSLTPIEASNANYLEQTPAATGVSLADLENLPSQHIESSTGDHLDFQSFWNEQPGVQHTSFD
jgi:hypothetical protein